MQYAQGGYEASFGTYEIDERAHNFTCHVEGALFIAAVAGLGNPAITWTASGGTINDAGLYTAPAAAGTYIVTANAAPSRRGRSSAGVTPGSAVVTVTALAPPAVTSNIHSVSPTAASLLTGAQQQFSAMVSGTSNSAVTWSASGGSIAATGMYKAPSNAGTYTITANKRQRLNQVRLGPRCSQRPAAGGGQHLSPGSASVEEANQVQFTATVSGLSNTAVTWVVTRGTGTITQSGLFTAPQAARATSSLPPVRETPRSPPARRLPFFPALSYA